MKTRIAVGGKAGTGGGSYDVTVRRGLLGELADLVGPAVRRVAVVHSRALGDRAVRLSAALASQGCDVTALELPDGEEARTAQVAARCRQRLGRAGLTRSDLIVGVGGWATTDLAGFVAACWLRGVDWIAVPTTLLGMVDAAVGGKTGINTSEGENLVGAFHPPAAVLCDLDALDTLPRADDVAGLAEVIKAGFIRDPKIPELIGADPASARTAHGTHTQELVERAIRVKAGVVATAGTRGPMRSRRTSASPGGTVRRCPWARSTPPNSLAWRAFWTVTRWCATARCSPR